MSNQGEIQNFDYERQDNGTFLYKAKDNISKRKVVKSQYQEKPQYPLIQQYENEAVKRFQQDIKNTVVQVVQFLKQTNHE